MSKHTKTQTAERLAVPFALGCALLGISRPTGYRLVADGTLKTFKVGARRYTTRTYLEAAIAKLAARSEPRCLRSSPTPKMTESA